MLMNLTKGNVMLTVVDRIDEKYGNIVALSLSNNRIRHLDYASALVSIAKFVKELDLSHNHVSHLITDILSIHYDCRLPLKRTWTSSPECQWNASSLKEIRFVKHSHRSPHISGYQFSSFSISGCFIGPLSFLSFPFIT